MTIPILGEKKEPGPGAFTQDDVPKEYLVHATVGDLDVYAEDMAVNGPVVQFHAAYALDKASREYKQRLNFMCFYTPVVWHMSPEPEWWKNRKKFGVAK
jgi:hypothetical protein